MIATTRQLNDVPMSIVMVSCPAVLQVGLASILVALVRIASAILHNVSQERNAAASNKRQQAFALSDAATRQNKHLKAAHYR